MWAILSKSSLAAEDNFSAFSAGSDLEERYELYLEAKNQFSANTKDEAFALTYAKSIHEWLVKDTDVKVKLVMPEYKTLEKAFPNNRRISAYRASALCRSAKDTWFIPTKLSRVKKCIKQMDEILTQSQYDPVIRSIRAGTVMHLPARFNQTEVAINDILALLERGEFAALAIDNIEQRLWAQLVILYKKTEEPAKQKHAMKQLLSLNPDNDLIAIAESLASKGSR